MSSVTGQAVALFNRQRITTSTYAAPAARTTPGSAYQASWSAPRTLNTRISSTAGTARPRDERLMMQVMLDDTLLATFRRALFSASTDLITLLRVQPDPRDAHRVKVWLGLNRPSVRAVIDLIIATLPEAEIGRMAPV